MAKAILSLFIHSLETLIRQYSSDVDMDPDILEHLYIFLVVSSVVLGIWHIKWDNFPLPLSFNMLIQFFKLFHSITLNASDSKFLIYFGQPYSQPFQKH